MPALATMLRTFPGSVACVAGLSGLLNLLCLTGSFFMLEVYDRVIPSRSIPTLVGLCALAGVLYLFQGLMEILRARMLVRLAEAVDQRVAPPVFDAVTGGAVQGVPDGLLPLRDLDAVRTYLSGNGPAALCDLPWIPLYAGICYVFHPLIGAVAVGGVAVLVLLTLASDLTARAPSRSVTRLAGRRQMLAETGRRNAHALVAMGMQERHADAWLAANREYVRALRGMGDVSTAFATLSRIFRTALQSGVLAIGAWLVVEGNATGGVMIASSILVSRALAPAEQAIAAWKGQVAARQAWGRIRRFLERAAEVRRPMDLPVPERSFAATAVSVAVPGTDRLAAAYVTFTLKAGQAMGVIGPSASGKSSLVRALVGIWPCAKGNVRIDGATLSQWHPASLGRHVGFLPQECELLAGTVAQNIARFEEGADPARVVAAARCADIHDLILALPHGYDTEVGEGGCSLSSGQRQRVGLARALYGEPFLVVLDEPNSNLDSEGENALTHAILKVRARGGICIVVAHRPSALAAVDTVLVMDGGRVASLGPRDEVLRQVLKPVPVRDAAPVEPAFAMGSAR